MIRRAALLVAALCLSASWLYAQSTEFTVTSASATIYKGPSTGSVVVGQAPRGTILKVTRELGSWVKVSWPGTPDDTGYVHLSMGSIGHPMPAPNPPVGMQAAIRTAPATAPAPPPIPARVERTSVGETPSGIRTVYVRQPSHVVGVGALMSGSPLGIGATARTWPKERIGIQFGLSHEATTNDLTAEKLTSVQFMPSVLYSFKNRVTDYVIMRPYAGGGVNIHHHSLSGGALVPGTSVSESGLGYQALGGLEATFASVPRFTLSADFGYQWMDTPAQFTGFEFGGPIVAVSGHWYLK
jgi:hypothetical protein